MANVMTRTTPEETRARIVTTAETLFKRLGFAKTTVADIAAELGMSPANVYRFFPSKHAIVEAICKRCVGEIDENAWAIARGRGSARDRLERLFHGILKYHKDNFISENRLHDIVLVAIDENWDAVLAHKEAVRNAIELIIRDGIDGGEFEPVDPRETSSLLLRAMVGTCHPVLVAKSLQDGENLEANASDLLRFLLRSISKQG
jgi:AcrR family transcriptional regulator